MKYGLKHSYLLSSALLLYCALTIPTYCFFCVFLYLIPLFYAVIRNGGIVSFKEGILWSVLLYGLHWYDVAILAQMHGQGIARYAVMPFLVLYSACYAGIWFFIASALSRVSKKPEVAWISTTWLYIVFMQRASFWILGRVQGYPFSFPLIPLAEHPQLLYALQFMHPHILLLLLILASWYSACAWHAKNSWAARSVAVGCYAPFVLGLLIMGQKTRSNDDPPSRYKTLGYISPACLSEHLLERAGELAHCCNQLVRNNEQITHILTPESTLAIPLNAHAVLFETLTHNLIDEHLILVLGSQRKENDRYYNCCYFLQHCLIIHGYDKSLMMPFTEYIPNNWLNFEVINRIFLQDKIIMNSNSKKSVSFSDFCPMICSDYYLDWYDEPQKTAAPLLLMVNETWFEGKIMRRLMKLAARYGALARRQDIIYVGHTEGLYFSRAGRVWPLIRE